MKYLLPVIIICGILLVGFYVSAADDVITIPDPLEGKTIPEIINAITNLIVAIGFSVAVIMIIWAAILYMTAGGNEEKVKTAKKALMWTVIGIAILLSAKFIIQLIEELLKGG